MSDDVDDISECTFDLPGRIAKAAISLGLVERAPSSTATRNLVQFTKLGLKLMEEETITLPPN